jgi:RNA polymerase primary sigma factor
MLKRKAMAPKNASRDSHRNEKPAKATTPTVRRRFVISSKALKPEAVKPEPVKPKSTAAATNAPVKLVKTTNGHAPGANSPSTPSTGTSTVDLTETIKTLVHLGQEHGYITYDDINDILPDNLSPDDLDILLTKLRGLDVEIVMDQAEAERAERKQPEQAEEAADEDSRLEILDDPVRM